MNTWPRASFDIIFPFSGSQYIAASISACHFWWQSLRLIFAPTHPDPLRKWLFAFWFPCGVNGLLRALLSWESGTLFGSVWQADEAKQAGRLGGWGGWVGGWGFRENGFSMLEVGASSLVSQQHLEECSGSYPGVVCKDTVGQKGSQQVIHLLAFGDDRLIWLLCYGSSTCM